MPGAAGLSTEEAAPRRETCGSNLVVQGRRRPVERWFYRRVAGR